MAADIFNERMRVVVHEAGHCVIALETGGTARVQLIEHGDELSGHTYEAPGPQHEEPGPYYFRRSLVAAAGEIAEEKFFGSAPNPWCVASDHAQLEKCAASLALDEAAMVRDVHRRVVRAFNNERIWRAVIALAGALFASWPNDGTGIAEISDATLRAVVGPWVSAP